MASVTEEDAFEAWTNYLRMIEKAGGLVIFSADNYVQRHEETRFVEPDKIHWRNTLSNVLLVRATDSNDMESSVTRKDPFDTPGNPAIEVWAQGERLTCLNHDTQGLTTATRSGTSFAAPQVAGLAATLMSGPNPPKTAAELKKRIIGLFWVRVPGGKNVIYNGIWDKERCSAKRSLRQRVPDSDQDSQDNDEDSVCTLSEAPSAFSTATVASSVGSDSVSDTFSMSSISTIAVSSTSPTTTTTEISTTTTTTAAASPTVTQNYSLSFYAITEDSHVTTAWALVTAPNVDQFAPSVISAEESNAAAEVEASISVAATALPTPTCISKQPGFDGHVPYFSSNVDYDVKEKFKTFCDSRQDFSKLDGGDAGCNGDYCSWQAEYQDSVMPYPGSPYWSYVFSIFKQGDLSKWPDKCEELLDEAFVTCEGDTGPRYGGNVTYDSGLIGWKVISTTFEQGSTSSGYEP